MSTCASDGLRAVLFDLDGVLVDSRTAVARSLNHGLRALGLAERREAELHRFIGPPLREAFEELLREAGADPARADEGVALYRERYGEACVRETRVMGGIRPVLSRLAGALPLAVATSKPEVYARPILEATGLAGFFRAVAGPPLEATHLESKAATAARALAALETDAARAALVGDRRHDVEAGRALGLRTVGVLWGIGSRTELEAAGVGRVVEAPGALLEALGAS